MIGPALQEITIVLCQEGLGYPNYFVPESRHPRPLGILSDVLERLVPHLDDVRLTLVGLKSASGPALGPLPPISDALARAIAPPRQPLPYEDLDKHTAPILAAKFLRSMARRIRAFALDSGWDQDRTDRAVGNVRVLSRDDWETEVDDEALTSWWFWPEMRWED
jgi:hypothetical protein